MDSARRGAGVYRHRLPHFKDFSSTPCSERPRVLRRFWDIRQDAQPSTADIENPFSPFTIVSAPPHRQDAPVPQRNRHDYPLISRLPEAISSLVALPEVDTQEQLLPALGRHAVIRSTHLLSEPILVIHNPDNCWPCPV